MRTTAEQRVDRFQLKSPKGRDTGAPRLLGQTPVRTYAQCYNNNIILLCAVYTLNVDKDERKTIDNREAVTLIYNNENKKIKATVSEALHNITGNNVSIYTTKYIHSTPHTQ